MASHKSTLHRFRSVAIGIHGWDGACKSTFGQGQSNMLKAISLNGGFDVDCFDYNSRRGTIENARACLMDRLVDLRKQGYREFSFITHSTGGIIGLELILREALKTPTSEALKHFIFDPDNGLKLKGLHAWAIPINGVLDTTKILGSIPRFWAWLKGEHESILPHLSADSNYLKQLRSKIGQLDALLSDASGADAQLNFNMFILQGGAYDLVVRDVSKQDDWWPKALSSELVSTKTVHIRNVGKSGTAEVPGFPAFAEEQILKLEFGLYPRFKPYFSADTLRTSETERLRAEIVGGIVSYASDESLFSNASSAISELIERVFNGGYIRSREDDERVATQLTKLINFWVGKSNKVTALRVATSMLDDLDLHLENARHDNPTRFGGGSKRALRILACNLKDIFTRIAVRNRKKVQASLTAAHQSRLEAFETRMVSIFTRLLRATGEDPERYSCALGAIAEAAGSVGADSVKSTNLISSLQQAALVGQGRLPAAVQASYGEIFSTFAKRADLRETTITALRSQAPQAGAAGVQLWRTFMTNAQARDLGIELATETRPKEPGFDFVLDVINSAGATQNVPDISVDLSRKVFEGMKEAPASLKGEAYNGVLEALRTSPYPSYEGVMRRELRDGGVLLAR